LAAGQHHRTLQAIVPYRGLHQAGITTPTPQEAIFIAFDVLARDRRACRKPCSC
jgi:deferrochelatase/peroxidase EfeB